MWPKNAAPPGVLPPSRAKSHRAPGSLAQGFSRARKASMFGSCAALSPSPKKTEARRVARVSFYLSDCPAMRATAPGRRHLYEVGGESPTQRRLVPLRSMTGSRGSGTAPRQGREGAPTSRHRHPQASASLERPSLLPGLKMGLPSACHNPHPQKQAQELGAHRPLGRSLHCHRAALSNASRPQKGLSTPCPVPPCAPSPGLETPGPRARSPLVQSTTCLGLHLVTGSMVNGFTPSWDRGGGKVLLPAPAVLPGGRAPRLSPRARAPRQGCMAAVSGSSGAAQRERRGPLPAHGTACGSSSSCHRPAAAPPPPPPPPAAAAGSPILLRLLSDRSCGDSALRPPEPLASARLLAAAPPHRRSRPGARWSRRALPGPRSARAAVGERSRPQVPPPAPPSRQLRGRQPGRAGALGLQSFSSGRCSRNKRGGGADDLAKLVGGGGSARNGRLALLSLSRPWAHTPGASRAALSFSKSGLETVRASPGAPWLPRGPGPVGSRAEQSVCLDESDRTRRHTGGSSCSVRL